jgi:hypothetical protein
MIHNRPTDRPTYSLACTPRLALMKALSQTCGTLNSPQTLTRGAYRPNRREPRSSQSRLPPGHGSLQGHPRHVGGIRRPRDIRAFKSIFPLFMDPRRTRTNQAESRQPTKSADNRPVLALGFANRFCSSCLSSALSTRETGSGRKGVPTKVYPILTTNRLRLTLRTRIRRRIDEQTN